MSLKIIDAAEFVLCATNVGRLYPAFCHLARFTALLPVALEQDRYWKAFVRERALGIVQAECFKGDQLDMTLSQFGEAVRELRRHYHDHVAECDT